jgi:hypothetical protein
MPSLAEHERQITQPAVHSLTAICTRGFQQLFGTIEDHRTETRSALAAKLDQLLKRRGEE